MLCKRVLLSDFSQLILIHFAIRNMSIMVLYEKCVIFKVFFFSSAVYKLTDKNNKLASKFPFFSFSDSTLV